MSDRHLTRAAEADEPAPLGMWHAAWQTLGLDALASHSPESKAGSGDRASARCRAGRSLAAAPGYLPDLLERDPCRSRQPSPLHSSDRASMGRGRFSRGLEGVARVEHDGWEKAAAASIWSALVSEGFHLMKAANKKLLSLSEIDEAAGEVGAPAQARRDAIAALLVALARFEAVRRLFGGRCYNSDLARNTGLPSPRRWHPCSLSGRTTGCVSFYGRVAHTGREPHHRRRGISRAHDEWGGTAAGLAYAQVAEEARRATSALPASPLQGLRHEGCSDAAHAALSVYVHSVDDPETDIVAGVVQRSCVVAWSRATQLPFAMPDACPSLLRQRDS